jgi:hypothetical protein
MACREPLIAKQEVQYHSTECTPNGNVGSLQSHAVVCPVGYALSSWEVNTCTSGRAATELVGFHRCVQHVWTDKRAETAGECAELLRDDPQCAGQTIIQRSKSTSACGCFDQSGSNDRHCRFESGQWSEYSADVFEIYGTQIDYECIPIQEQGREIKQTECIQIPEQDMTWSPLFPECHGADIHRVHGINTLNDCQQACENDSDCLFITFGFGSCWLKNGRISEIDCPVCNQDGTCGQSGDCDPETSYCGMNLNRWNRGRCDSWCDGNNDPWTTKCGWKECVGCGGCSTAFDFSEVSMQCDANQVLKEFRFGQFGCDDNKMKAEYICSNLDEPSDPYSVALGSNPHFRQLDQLSAGAFRCGSGDLITGWGLSDSFETQCVQRNEGYLPVEGQNAVVCQWEEAVNGEAPTAGGNSVNCGRICDSREDCNSFTLCGETCHFTADNFNGEFLTQPRLCTDTRGDCRSFRNVNFVLPN